MTGDLVVVPGRGRLPNPILLIGQSPGEQEAIAGKPFVGISGIEQDAYLRQWNVSAASWRINNVVQEYRSGNPAPTPDQLRFWSPKLEAEVRACNPRLIVAVGRFAAEWFLGPCTMEIVHGVAHRAGAFNPELARRAPAGAVVFPIFHPAYALHDKTGDARSFVWWDYRQLATAVKQLELGRAIPVRHDELAGREQYLDCTGAEIEHFMGSLWRGAPDAPIAVDTEGSVRRPWSIQVSGEWGTGFALRRSQLDFARGIAALQARVDAGARVVLHNAMFDIGMCRAMGLRLRRAEIWDSMYALYLLRLEPQGLKAAAWRWCGMRMTEYSETVGAYGGQKQLDYLGRIFDWPAAEWPKPEQEVEELNDGTLKLKQPQAIPPRAERLLADCYFRKRNKEGELVDPEERWHKWPHAVRAAIEDRLGQWPSISLADVPLERAIAYSARDSDATLRLHDALVPVLASMDLSRTMSEGMAALPVFEEMQHNGMLADHDRVVALTARLQGRLRSLRARISSEFFGGRPYNPNSRIKTMALLIQRGHEPTKLTKKGKPSVGKKSIEHLRYVDEAIGLHLEWKEHAKIRDAFCNPLLRRYEQLGDAARRRGETADRSPLFPVNGQIKNTRVATRRLAMNDPNLLQVPTRTEIGNAVRECYVVPPGYAYFAADLSQIEVRCVAEISQDAVLCDTLRRGEDVHEQTASRIFGLPIAELDKNKHRKPAKAATFGCVPLDSLALTPSGWTAHTDIVAGDLVMGYDERDGRLRWTPVLEKMVYEEPAPLVRTSCMVWSAVSTPNHRWYGRCRVQTAGQRHYVPRVVETAEIGGENILTLSAPVDQQARYIAISCAEAELIGWILGDGHIDQTPLRGAWRTSQGSDGRRRGLRVVVCQAKEVGVLRLRQLLGENAIPYNEQRRKGWKDTMASVFCLRAPYARDLFARSGFRDMPLDRWVLRLDTEQLHAFVDGFWGAEGCVDKRGHRIIKQNEGEVLEAVRLAIFLCGYRPSKNVNDTRGNAINYGVRFRRPEVTGQRIVKEDVAPAPVWCLRTELGSWVMKQGDEMMVTGNSLYGIGGDGLYTQLRMMGCGDGWSIDSCQQLLDGWWDLYDGIKAEVAATAAQVRRDGFVRDLSGMYRFLPGIWADDRAVQSAASREAFSHRVQGMAQTMVQRSMVWIADQLLELQEAGYPILWRLQIHDELILSAPEELIDVVQEVVIEGLQHHHGVAASVPILAEGQAAASWGKLK